LKLYGLKTSLAWGLNAGGFYFFQLTNYWNKHHCPVRHHIQVAPEEIPKNHRDIALDQ
jgi:hypothetical protein